MELKFRLLPIAFKNGASALVLGGMKNSDVASRRIPLSVIIDDKSGHRINYFLDAETKTVFVEEANHVEILSMVKELL